MKTVQDYLDLGLMFVVGDKVYEHIIESFAWRNNDGVKPEYEGLIDVEMKSGAVMRNKEAGNLMWSLMLGGHYIISKWRPVVLKSESPTVSPKEDKTMNPVYTAEMHARNELPPVGVECSLKSGSLTQWFNGVCVGYDEEFAVFKMCDDYPFGGRYAGFCHSRIKPIIKTINVNGFDIPEPMRAPPEIGCPYFMPEIASGGSTGMAIWIGSDFDKKNLADGLCYTDPWRAGMHDYALLGMNPND